MWLVNPKHGEIEEHACYPSIAALPAAPDLAVIVTPPATVPQLIEELGAKGHARRRRHHRRRSRRPQAGRCSRPRGRTCLRIQGPNCLGLMLPRIGLNASFSHQPPLAGDLAFLSQSGALITAIIDWARGRSIGFSHVVSLGDMADVDFGDLLDYLAARYAEPRHPALYGIGHARAEVHVGGAARGAIQARHRRQGRTQRDGAKAALSHTGALAGADVGL